MHGVRNLHPNTFVKKSTLNSDESVSLTCHLGCTNLHPIDIDKYCVLSSGVKVTASLVTQCSKQGAGSPQIPKNYQAWAVSRVHLDVRVVWPY